MINQSFSIVVISKPSVTASNASNLTASTATLNGEVTADGGATVTERGFVYALTSDDDTPPLAEVNGSTVFKIVADGVTVDAFSKEITGLRTNTSYTFIAYATNSVGTTESAVATFTTVNTPPTFTSTAIETVNEGDSYSYSITTNDADGDAVTVTATTLPSWLNLTTTPGGNVTTFAEDKRAAL